MTSRTIKIAPYGNMKSAGARNLKEGLASLLHYTPELVPSDYLIQPNEWIINWGNGHFMGRIKSKTTGIEIFNPAPAICLSVNKVDFFEKMKKAGIPVPEWTRSEVTASKWAGQGETVYCRTDIEGRDGRGIVVASRPQDIAFAPLYTKSVPSTEEFRAHVFRGEVIFELEKWFNTKEAGGKKPTKDQLAVRSGSNNWIYVRDTSLPAAAKKLAGKVSEALDLDFCAVDLLWDSKTGTTTVLESNTAPELGPWTRVAYAKKFVELLKKVS